jgi:hypothetical protein
MSMAPTDPRNLTRDLAIRPDPLLADQRLIAGETQAQPQNTTAHSGNVAQPFTVELVPAHLRMHTISEDKLEALISGNGSIHLTFFGICLGAAISFGIVLYNGGLDSIHGLVYESFLFLTGVMATFFGIKGGRDYLHSKAKLKEIQGRSMPS